MALWNNFPYTNTHELNLDWVISKMKELWEEWESYGTEVDADAVAGLYPDVTVTGDLKQGLTFHFTLVKGDQGDQGETGNGIDYCTFANYQLTIHFTDGTTYTTPSLKGDTGSGLQILDEYATLADLQTAHPVGSPGDAYLVGISPSFTLYIWSNTSASWVDGGALTNPSPSVTTPLMDGIADTGSEMAYARGDHVHPSDTSKQDVLTAGSGIDITSNVISVNAPIPQPSNNNPNMDGTSDAGSSANYSRADHIHPSDTSKQDVLTAGAGITIDGNNEISADIFWGVDPANIIATVNKATFTATTDCFAYMECTYDGNYGSYKLSNNNTEMGQSALIPLKSGDSVTYVRGGVKTIVFGKK